MKTYELNDFGVCTNPDVKRIEDDGRVLELSTACIKNKWVCGVRSSNKEEGYSTPCSVHFADYATKRAAIEGMLKPIIKYWYIKDKKVAELIQRELDDSKQLYLFGEV